MTMPGSTSTSISAISGSTSSTTGNTTSSFTQSPPGAGMTAPASDDQRPSQETTMPRTDFRFTAASRPAGTPAGDADDLLAGIKNGAAKTAETARTPGTPGTPHAALLRPSWSRRSSNAGVAGYLFIRAGDAVCRALLRDLEARERLFRGCHPVGVVDVAWLRPGVEEGTAATVPALAVYRDGREIARAIGASAVSGFIDALFAQAEAERGDEEEWGDGVMGGMG